MKFSAVLLSALFVSAISFSAVAKDALPPLPMPPAMPALPPAPPPAPALKAPDVDMPDVPAPRAAQPVAPQPLAAPQAPLPPAPPALERPNVTALPPSPPALPPAPAARQAVLPPAPTASAPAELAPLPASENLPVIVTENAGTSAQKGLKSMGKLISTQIKSCWRLPVADRKTSSLQAIINISQNGDLSLAGYTTEPTASQQALDASIRTALAECSPLKNLPPQEAYDDWKAVIITFNPRKR